MPTGTRRHGRRDDLNVVRSVVVRSHSNRSDSTEHWLGVSLRVPEHGHAGTFFPVTVGQARVYDRIGRSYRGGRREDARIAVAIWSALGSAKSVVNVGAGTGSYEPRDRRVVAVEPSVVMLAQRPPGAAPAVQGTAEELPFGDESFDAAMAVLSLHHWTDRARGLAEMRRVARGPVVIFLRDPEAAEPWWLYHYFPATARLVASRETPLDEVARTLGALDVVPVPIPADCNDGFEAAYWRRPQAILDTDVWPSMSALALIPASDRRTGMRELRLDLGSGEWHRSYSHLLNLDEFDLGYRVVVTRG